MSSIAKGIFGNSLANIFQKIVRILDQLLIVPFFLTSWGASYYGEWLTLSIIPSVLAFSDLGFGTAVSNAFTLSYASGNKQKAADLYKCGFWIISASVCLGTLITAIVLLIGKYMGLFTHAVIEADEAIVAVSLLMCSKLVNFYSNLSEGFFRAARKAAFGTFLCSLNSLVNIGVGIIVLYAGYGVVGYSLSQFVVAVIYAVLYWHVGRKQIDFSHLKGRILKQDIKDVVSKGIGYLASPLWQSIYFQGGTFVVRIVLGAESVAMFNTLRAVCRSVNQIYSIINASLFPEMQFEYGKGNLILVRLLFRMAIDTCFFVALAGCGLLLLCGLDVYSWWTNGELDAPYSVWFLFVMGTGINAVWWTAGMIYRMVNKPYHFAMITTLMAVVSILVSYILSGYYGLWGAAMGTVVFELVVALYVLPDTCKLLNMRMSDLYTHVGEDWRMIYKKLQKR